MRTAILLCALVATAFAAVPKFYANDKATIEFVNNQKSTWIAGENPYFHGKTLADVAALCGSLPEPEHIKAPLKDIEIAADIPTEFDSRTNWPNCPSIKEIRDQGPCGSCWAFGAVEAMSDRICIHSNGATKLQISAQDLAFCCRTCGNGCNGGFPSAAWGYFVNSGIVTGGLYESGVGCQPYTLTNCSHHESGPLPMCPPEQPSPRCSEQCVSGYATPFNQDKHYGSSHYSISSQVEKIQTEIQTNGPVEAAFTVYADFPTYRSGVYSHKTGGSLGGHAVKIIGWGVEDGQDYWLVANSWNDTWGLNGLFKILRGVDECGIESGIVAGIPK